MFWPEPNCCAVHHFQNLAMAKSEQHIVVLDSQSKTDGSSINSLQYVQGRIQSCCDCVFHMVFMLQFFDTVEALVYPEEWGNFDSNDVSHAANAEDESKDVSHATNAQDDIWGAVEEGKLDLSQTLPRRMSSFRQETFRRLMLSQALQRRFTFRRIQVGAFTQMWSCVRFARHR